LIGWPSERRSLVAVSGHFPFAINGESGPVRRGSLHANY
jgi:hypothetical protein